MMVTFVSECEKKALNKTRKVLDAFANRIGSRTWQTVITNEGLQAVQKLLRKTASKNTAVSCHWLRSRSRSELLWVVGQRDKFDLRGVVPVNWTDKKIIIGDLEIMLDDYFANTKGQQLDQHLFAVGFLGYKLALKLVDDDKLAKAVFLAGCWHDIGKIDPEFQKWLSEKLKHKKLEDTPEDGQHIDKATGKFSWSKHPRHNEISLLLYFILADESELPNQETKDRVKNAVYWHHAKPLRKQELKRLREIHYMLSTNLGEPQTNKLFSVVRAIVKSINTISENYFPEDSIRCEVKKINLDDDMIEILDQTHLPAYKRYSLKEKVSEYQNQVRKNAKNNLARSIVITADRLISKLSTEALSEHINSQSLTELLDEALLKERGLTQEIQICLDGFNKKYPESERNIEQTKAASKLADEEIEIGVLRGPAGCGKTKIALEWALNTKVKKLLWICPRVQICQGLFQDLTSQDYLPNSKIEICTGEFREIHQSGKITETATGSEFSGDVIITTIDQIINAITTHRNVTTLIDYMNAHVVFDEFHEYSHMKAFNLLFAELIECKNLQGKNTNTLLVSATPNPFFIHNFLGIDKDDVVGIDSFNHSTYNIEFVDYDEKLEDSQNPLYQTQEAGTFVISNTAITAQKSFIDNQKGENGLLLHSKFKKSDRKAIFECVMQCFGKNGDKNYAILRGGPVVQASLNITCAKMITEMTHAENWLQRLGRLNRFGENKGESIYLSAITEDVKTGKQKGGGAKFLAKLNYWQSTKSWYNYLIRYNITDKPISLTEIYNLYDRFYNDKSCTAMIEQDLIAALKKSVNCIADRLFDPVIFPSKKKVDDCKVRIKKHSLRGDSCFVQMAVCVIKNRDDLVIDSNYAYSLEAGLEDNLTMAIEQILGYGDSNQNLVSFMQKKHHNIVEDFKKAHKDSQLLNESRNPQTPIYVSYTPQDLNKVEAKAHDYAIYYAHGDKQVIGAISISKLTKGDK
jgi:CRISPR-associated endonuclease/helicase Cas3